LLGIELLRSPKEAGPAGADKKRPARSP
jgi:hypothetical protein